MKTLTIKLDNNVQNNYDYLRGSYWKKVVIIQSIDNIKCKLAPSIYKVLRSRRVSSYILNAIRRRGVTFVDTSHIM